MHQQPANVADPIDHRRGLCGGTGRRARRRRQLRHPVVGGAYRARGIDCMEMETLAMVAMPGNGTCYCMEM